MIVRTKTEGVTEGGICAGFAVMDNVAFINK